MADSEAERGVHIPMTEVPEEKRNKWNSKKVVFQPQKMLILLCDIIVFSLKQTRTSVAFFIPSLQRQNEEVLVNVLDKKVT